MRIRNRILLIMIGFLALVAIGFTALLYNVQLHSYESGIDAELRTAALMARDLLPPGYHERIAGKSSVPDAEYQRIVDRFNRICVDANLEYLWSLMVLDGKIVFTSATSPSKEASRRDHAGFLEVHANPELYTNAFATMQPQCKVNSDKWGRIRVVLLPFMDAKGRPYLIGASRSMQRVDAQIRATMVSSVLAGAGVLALGVLVCVFLAKSLSRPIEEITKAAAGIASGNLGQTVQVSGASELNLLGKSINTMSLAIQERMRDLAESRENLRITMQSIGDAVISTDAKGQVSWMNPVAETLTGWDQESAVGKPLDEVFRIVNAHTRQTVENPVAMVFREGRIIGLANHTVLLARSGKEWQIADSAAPIRSQAGAIMGVVLVFRDVTEEYAKDMALRESEEKLRFMTENSADVIWHTDLDYRLTYISASDQKLRGFKREEVIGRSVFDLFTPEGAEYVRRLNARRLEAERQGHATGVIRVEIQQKCKDGSVVWTEVNANPYRGADGALTGYYGVTRDISARVRAEEELRRSELKFRSLFENMNEGVALHELICDAGGKPLDYRLLELNPAYEKHTGIQAQKARGALGSVLYGAEQPPYLDIFSRVAQTGEPHFFEVFFPPLQRHFQISCFQQSKGCFATVFSDVTERKQAEQALEQRLVALTSPINSIASLNFEDLFDVREIQKIQDAFAAATGVASIITDTQGRPITQPSNFCKLCSSIVRNTEKGLANCYRSDAALGRMNPNGPIMQHCMSGGLWDGGASICAGDKHIANWLIGQVLDESHDPQAMLAYAREIGADENEFSKALSEVPQMPKAQFARVCEALFSIAGQLSRLAVQNVQQARHITERKRAEVERANLEAQIQQAQKLESLGVMAGGIAHDFNNLLVAIMGNADLALSEMSPTAPSRESIQDIITASRRAADLCKQMLAYSGKGRFFVEPLNLSEVVSEMLQMLAISISKNAVLHRHFKPGLPAVAADATQIRQVIMNLVINSSEAIGERSGVISIITSDMECDRAYLSELFLDQQLPEGRYVVLEVSDNGCGMDDLTRKRIFDPFFTTKFTGRGLGLAAVLGIVRGHKGAIKVYSEPGKGTTFKILLPAINAEASNASGLASPSVETDSHWRGHGTILLADDEPSVRTLAKRMLERLGFAVIAAADGREAVSLFKQKAPEITCVLLDLTMPHLDGAQTFIELRRIRPDIRVVLSSGYNEMEVADRFAGKGMAGFIQKPYTMASLTSILRHALDGNP